MNARGLLTTWRRNKVASSSRSIDDERNFGDFGYEVMVQHEDRAEIEIGKKKELHVLKKKLKEEHEDAQAEE